MMASCALCVAVVGILGAASALAQIEPSDPFFPHSGDVRYDVSHYDVRISFQAGSGNVNATATIKAMALEPLSRFSLDLDGLHVTRVDVDAKRAAFARGKDKLAVTPAEPLPANTPFTAVVHYKGRPRKVIEPDGSLNGWLRTSDGALAVGESVGTPSWLPCNDRLSDKATFDVHLTVPGDLKGVSNGRLLHVTRRGSRKTFHWREDQPMDPYLAVIDIGRGKLVHSEISGIPTWTMVDPNLVMRWRRALAALPGILRFESRIFGPYPFDAAGSIVDAGGFENALETQTRPIYDLPPGRIVIVHEMAHQWFGDSVGLRRWPDIWLNEGFATWAQWYYQERHGGPSALRTFQRFRHAPAFVTELWNPPPGNPRKPRNLFAPSIYLRGGMALEALRLKIGTSEMLETLHDWASVHRYGSADTSEFIELAERVSRRPLGPLFHRWLFEPGKP
jgi:aminopeptidase N